MGLLQGFPDGHNAQQGGAVGGLVGCYAEAVLQLVVAQGHLAHRVVAQQGVEIARSGTDARPSVAQCVQRLSPADAEGRHDAHACYHNRFSHAS